MLNGVLRYNPKNSRYFSDASGKAVYLAGSHNWFVQQDFKLDGEMNAFDYDGFLSMMVENKHNFMRYWQFALQASGAGWTKQSLDFSPLPYQRLGPGLALDGLPKFDLDKWNEDYFVRLRERVRQAGEKGIYVAVLMFEGWCGKNKSGRMDSWLSHPYNVQNNVNGDDGGDQNIFTLDISAIVRREEAFVKKVIDTLNDLDNVLYEIVNEVRNEFDSKIWQMHMIDFIHKYEKGLPKQHPVGISASGAYEDNVLLMHSNADWVAPGIDFKYNYRIDPPAMDGKKVVIMDTDHICALDHAGDRKLVWKCFTRGYNYALMDPWVPLPGKLLDHIKHWEKKKDDPVFEDARKNIGYTLMLAERVDLNRMFPRDDLANSGYCLADPGEAYIVYVPEGGEVAVDLCAYDCEFTYEWFSPEKGEIMASGVIMGGRADYSTNFKLPFKGDAVLFLKQKST
ncbi:MAG: DUF6298 domain-containing protein [Christensenellales bacterium]|jgi:hypothetical protein